MSKSKEGIDQNLADSDPNRAKNINQPTADELDRQTGGRGQTDYTYGRESSRDFPKRSTAERFRSEKLRQSSHNPERANFYDQQQRAGSRQPNQYEDRRWQSEDTGDLYSRGIRERLRGNETERNRLRGGNFEADRQYDDPYRSYDRDRQTYNNQRDRWQQNQADYGNQQGYGSQSTTRDFGTPNDDSPEYGQRNSGPQNFGTPNYRPQNDARQNYGPQGYNPQTYNDERVYQNRRDFNQEPDRFRDERQNTGYDRTAPFSRGYEYLGSPMGFDMPYYDANAVGYDWQGRPMGRNAILRCSDIMTKDITACSPESTIREVAEKMEDDNVGSIPVVENGRLIGLVTDRDIVCRILADGKNTRTATAREAMTEDIVTASPDESVMEVIRKMGEHQIRRLPICDLNGRLRGMISIGDIALEAERDREIACALERISAPTPYRAHRR